MADSGVWGTYPMEDQFSKQIQAKKELVAKKELNQLALD